MSFSFLFLIIYDASIKDQLPETTYLVIIYIDYITNEKKLLEIHWNVDQAFTQSVSPDHINQQIDH